MKTICIPQSSSHCVLSTCVLSNDYFIYKYLYIVLYYMVSLKYFLVYLKTNIGSICLFIFLFWEG